MKIKILEPDFSVCKIDSLEEINFKAEFLFIGKTDEEISMVCKTENIPRNHIECESGWRAFRIEGVLEFSIIGLLAKISSILANHSISIFAISTYNTDYILIKKAYFLKAIHLLAEEGYEIV